MDGRHADRIATVQASLPRFPPPPAGAINPLKERLTQLKKEFATAPAADRGRIATAITHVENLIQRLERQNGSSSRNP